MAALGGEERGGAQGRERTLLAVKPKTGPELEQSITHEGTLHG